MMSKIMNNNDTKNQNNHDDEVSKLINNLRKLPDVKLPSDFDRKLKDRIALENQKGTKGMAWYSNFSKSMILGGSLAVVACLVVISVILSNRTGEPVFKNSRILL